MNEKISVTPNTIFLENLLEDIANGEYKIPIFQREFVWDRSQMLDLFDSILKGYPIGSLLLWKTEEFKTKNEIGPYIINKENKNFRYILDGFQRISTLFGALMNPKNFLKENINSSENNKYLIYFNIKENNFAYVRSARDNNIVCIPLYEIYDNRELFNIFRKLDKEDITEDEKDKCIENARNLHDILHKYKLPYVEIKGGDIKSAGEIFSRVNSTGTQISEDSMLSALTYTYDKDGEFFLFDSITEFLNKLNIYNFDDLKRGTVLNCIYNATGKFYYDVKREDLVKEKNLKSFTEKAYVHIQKAVSFLYKKLFLIDVRLLPYTAQFIFISEYFRLHSCCTSEQEKALENWFWITTYSNYFTLYSFSQQRSAYEVFFKFAQGEHISGIYKVNDDLPFKTSKYPDKLNFQGVRPKALQLFYLKSIIGNNEVQNQEGIKQMFVFPSSTKYKNPGNIILRLSSEFEEDKNKKIVENFIETSSSEVLDKHFITPEIVELYKQNQMDEFISKRNEYFKTKEREFVANMGIDYTY